MNRKPSFVPALIVLILVGAICRVAGFDPQIAMVVFGGVVISNKRLAVILPLLSMFLSDVLYEVLFRLGYADYGGFYEGQITNYILIAAVVLIGFWASKGKWVRVVAATFAAPTLYFLASNFLL